VGGEWQAESVEEAGSENNNEITPFNNDSASVYSAEQTVRPRIRIGRALRHH